MFGGFSGLDVCGNFSFDYFIVFVLGKCCEVWFRELFGIIFSE